MFNDFSRISRISGSDIIDFIPQINEMCVLCGEYVNSLTGPVEDSVM